MSRVDYVFDNQFERGKQYVIYVTQVNSYGLESEFSDPAFITAGSEDIPPPVLTVGDGSFDSSDSIKVPISWLESSNQDLDFYQIYLYKGVPDWFSGDGYYTDYFPSNSKKFTASKNQLDLVFQNLEHDQIYTAGIETVDVFGNVSGMRYVLSFLAKDLSNVQSPGNEIHGNAQGYWCLHIWTNKPNDPSAKYLQFFRDGITPLSPVDCRSSNIVDILDSLDHDDGLTHRYSYNIIRFDGKKSELSPLSDPFTANQIDEFALDPALKNKWKEEFLEDIEDRVDTLELEHIDHDRKIRDLQDGLRQLGDEAQSRDNRLQDQIDNLFSDSENTKKKLDHCCLEVNQKLNDLQSQINTLKSKLDKKADKSYVDNQIQNLNDSLRNLIDSKINSLSQSLKNYVLISLNSYATKQYVDAKISSLDSSLRQVISNSIESSKQSILYEVQSRIDKIINSTVPNLIRASTNALEKKLKKYSDDQDSALYNRIISLFNQLKNSLNSKFEGIDSKITACKNYTDSQIYNLKTNVNNTFKNYIKTDQVTQYVQAQLSDLNVALLNTLRNEIKSAKNEIETAYKRYTDNAVNNLKYLLFLPRIQTLENRVTYLSNQNATLNSRISNLLTTQLAKMGITEQAFKKLGSRLTQAENDIANLISRVNNLEITVCNLTKNLTTNIDSKINTWWTNLVNAGLNLKNVTIEYLIISKSLTIRDGATVNGLDLSSSFGGSSIPTPEPTSNYVVNEKKWQVNMTLTSGTTIGTFLIPITPSNSNKGSGSAINISIDFVGIIAVAMSNSFDVNSYLTYPYVNSWKVYFDGSSVAGKAATISWINPNSPYTGFEQNATHSVNTEVGSVDLNQLRDFGVNQSSDKVFLAVISASWTGSVVNKSMKNFWLKVTCGNTSQFSLVKSTFTTKDTFTVTYT